jgi:hypothetical protein
MQYEAGDPIIVTFDNPDEIQAITWAASEVHFTNPDDSDALSAYESACALYSAELRDREFKDKDFTLRANTANAMISVLHRWVELGPPRPEGQATDAARAKSYITACRIVERTVELS